MTLTRRDYKNSHSYWNDGVRLEGVTTLLGAGMNKPGLMYWSAKSVAEHVYDNFQDVQKLIESVSRDEAVKQLKNVPWEVRNKAAVKGTKVHKLADKIMNGQEVEVPEEYRGYIEGYIKFLKSWQFIPIMTETSVFNTLWQYAGTFDIMIKCSPEIVIEYNLPGPIGCIDIKTSNSIYGETALQTSGYLKCDKYLDENGEVQEMTIKPDFTAAFHVRSDGTDFVPLCMSQSEIETAYKDFLHVAHMARAADRIKSYVKPIIHFKAA